MNQASPLPLLIRQSEGLSSGPQRYRRPTVYFQSKSRLKHYILFHIIIYSLEKNGVLSSVTS